MYVWWNAKIVKNIVYYWGWFLCMLVLLIVCFLKNHFILKLALSFNCCSLAILTEFFLCLHRRTTTNIVRRNTIPASIPIDIRYFWLLSHSSSLKISSKWNKTRINVSLTLFTWIEMKSLELKNKVAGIALLLRFSSVRNNSKYEMC